MRLTVFWARYKLYIRLDYIRQSHGSTKQFVVGSMRADRQTYNHAHRLIAIFRTPNGVTSDAVTIKSISTAADEYNTDCRCRRRPLEFFSHSYTRPTSIASFTTYLTVSYIEYIG